MVPFDPTGDSKDGREAYGVIRCFYGPNSVLVWIHRFKSKDVIRHDWGTDKETKVTLDRLPDVGEEVRSYQQAFTNRPIDVTLNQFSAFLASMPKKYSIEKLEEYVRK